MSLQNNSELSFLEEYRSDYPELIQKIESAEEKFMQQRERFADNNPDLSIGIIGQVKAGKSTFLNSLLFNGRNLLPTAATPKTANLTRIRYAEKPSFTAIFYSPEQWEDIVKKANSGQDALIEVKAAKEMVESVKKSGENVEKLLAEGKKVIKANNIDELMKELNTYVGGDGRLTALVSETELAIKIEELKGIEIVDTPGMNDPVVSRIAQTQKYIGNCDVVFFLARSSQFLDESDQNLLSSQLPEGGVRKLILEGSQFDTTVLEAGYGHDDFQECIEFLNEDLAAHAEKVFKVLASKHIEKAEYYQQESEDALKNNNKRKSDDLISQKEKELKIADLLKFSAKPIFSSTYAYSIVNYLKNNVDVNNWDESIKNTYDLLNNMANAEWEQTLQLSDFEKLSNFAPLQEELKKAKADKKKILKERKDNLEKNIKLERNANFTELMDSVNSKLHTLKNNSLATLNEQVKKEEKLLEKISDALYNFIENVIDQVKNRQSDIINSISDKAEKAKKVEMFHDTRPEKRNNGGNKDKAWYKPWSWGDDHYKEWWVNVEYDFLRVSDVIRKLENYATLASHDIKSAFGDINPKLFEINLFKVLNDLLDVNNDDNFDSTNLRNIVKISLISLNDLPDLDVEINREVLEKCFNGFPNDVENDYYIEQIKKKVEDITKQIGHLLLNKLDDAIDEVIDKLENINSNLKNKLQKDHKIKIDSLREDIKNKEVSIAKCENLIASLKKCIG